MKIMPVKSDNILETEYFAILLYEYWYVLLAISSILLYVCDIYDEDIYPVSLSQFTNCFLTLSQ